MNFLNLLLYKSRLKFCAYGNCIYFIGVASFTGSGIDDFSNQKNS